MKIITMLYFISTSLTKELTSGEKQYLYLDSVSSVWSMWNLYNFTLLWQRRVCADVYSKPHA